jgi:hypothetical protein
VTGSPSKAPGPGLSTSASVKVRTMTSKLITSRGPQYPRAPVDIKTQVPSVTWLSLHRTHAGPLMQGQSYLHSRYTVSFRDNDKKKKSLHVQDRGKNFHQIKEPLFGFCFC